MLEEVVERGIAAILPVYDEGNVTRLITTDGDEIINRRTCRTVLKNLARIYGVDLSAIRQLYRKPLNKKLGVPIPLGIDILLIPVKFRKKPLGANDGTMGYVNFEQIHSVESEERTTSLIELKSGVIVRPLVSKDTVLEYMKNARLVKNLYIKRHLNSEEVFKFLPHFTKEATAQYHANLLGIRLLQLILMDIFKTYKSQAE
jgi:hypothetical protein